MDDKNADNWRAPGRSSPENPGPSFGLDGRPAGHEPDNGRGNGSSPEEFHVHGGLMVIVVAVVVLFGIIWLQNTMSNLSPQIHPVNAPAQTVSRNVALTPGAPARTGKVTVRFVRDSNYGALSIGMSQGMPAVTQGHQATIGLFSDPLVRLSAARQQSTQQCAGPCEIQLDHGDCTNSCTLVYSIRLELVAPDEYTSDAQVEVLVSAAASEPLERSLPDGLTIDVAFDAPPAPTPAGGS